MVEGEHGAVGCPVGELASQELELPVAELAAVDARDDRVERDDAELAEPVNLIDGRGDPVARMTTEQLALERGPIVVVARDEDDGGRGGRRESLGTLAQQPVGERICGVGEVAGEQDGLRPAG